MKTENSLRIMRILLTLSLYLNTLVFAGQVLNKLDRGGVIVGTHNSFSGLIARKLINLSAFNLLVIDNLQVISTKIGIFLILKYI